ncbi:MAG: HNH endonuclease [Rhodocyclaceae bacterium]|nr:HNH endonuclease [Rhodocyclaceae bacterium]MBX3669717.1 HNH endonuclease [Rhodocyclaceae bacterium]
MARTFATVRDLLYWEYAKLIAGSAMGDRAAYGFVTVTYNKLRAGKLTPSAIVTENKRLIVEGEACAYCGATAKLEWEHVIPLAAGGPDTIDNLVRACRACNAAKGARDPYQWLLDQPGKEVPRLVLGKMLKLLFEAYEKRDLLDSSEFMKQNDIRRRTLAMVFARMSGASE